MKTKRKRKKNEFFYKLTKSIEEEVE